VREREQREHAALAPVVEAQDEGDVLERHDEHDRPEDQRQHAVDVRVADRKRMRARERLLERVQRAGADVAEYHADRAERERGEAVGVAPCVGRGE
jgi:hypothetical protein